MYFESGVIKYLVSILFYSMEDIICRAFMEIVGDGGIVTLLFLLLSHPTTKKIRLIRTNIK
jgi:hypothetical protein